MLLLVVHIRGGRGANGCGVDSIRRGLTPILYIIFTSGVK